MQRQQDRKGSALAGVGLRAEDAAMLFHNLMRHGEPQPGPGLLSGEEGIEDAVAIRGADAATLVPHLDEDASVLRPRGEQHAAFGHRRMALMSTGVSGAGSASNGVRAASTSGRRVTGGWLAAACAASWITESNRLAASMARECGGG